MSNPILSYLPVRFSLRFASPAVPDVPPLFALRSVLGKQLRSMSCISRGSKCHECMYGRACAYAFLFETILPQGNDIVPGRDRASHPFAFTRGTAWRKGALGEYDFTMTLLGKAADYLPYVYAAFVRAGRGGLFKSRTPFEVAGVSAEGESLLIDTEHLDTSVSAKAWAYDGALPEKSGEALVELKSPLRFKYDGKYGADFSAGQFLACLYRRMKTLCLLYGSADGMPGWIESTRIVIGEKSLRWEEGKHYSARQKSAMSLGGVVGTLKLRGTFSALEQNLLEFSRTFGAGKSTNFGLGQMDFWAKWE